VGRQAARRGAVKLAVAEVLIVAGEPSGDAIGAELVDAARKMEPSMCFFGATGPALEAAGAKRVVATRELTTMGLTEVLPRLPAIRRAMKRLERAAADHRTIGAVLIDSPDFNLRLARKLDRRSIPVVQYVSPSVWGWRPGRVSAIEKSVRRVLLTLPFEAEFYRDSCVDAVYVGHPALDRIPADVGDRQAVAVRLGLNASHRWVALLPGSRSGELDRMGPLLAESAARIRRRIPDIEFMTMVAPGLDPSAVASALAGVSGLKLVETDRHVALGHCDAAIVTSGTVSLELAILGVPHVVAYRLSHITFAIARRMARVRWIALPNLIAGRVIVPELIQRDAEPHRLAQPVIEWLEDDHAAATIREELRTVSQTLGPAGVAERAARAALSGFGIHVE
jgi:lipid-A-disaccharide synthase